LTRLLIVLVILASISCSPARATTAALIKAGLPGEDAALADDLAKTIAAAGYECRTIGLDDLCDPTKLSAKSLDLLVLPDSSALPALAMEPIKGYLEAGGNIMALNTPMWQRVLVKAGDRWITREEYQASANLGSGLRRIIDYQPETMSKWYLSNSNPVPGLVHECIECGAPGEHALHVVVPNLIGWDAYSLPRLDKPFRSGETLTVFRAKGGPKTTQMGVEWDEQDGSRWIAVIDLTQDWKQYVLAPQDFRYHTSNYSRGYAGDRFKPENAVSFNVQSAVGVTEYRIGDPQEFWVGPISTIKPTPEMEPFFAPYTIPELDTLCPCFHFHDCTEVAGVAACLGMSRPAPAMLTSIPRTIRAPHPRPSAGGFDKGRGWRWIPVLEARNEHGEWRGNPGTLLLHAPDDHNGGMWASFGIDDPAWYRSRQALDVIKQVAKQMRIQVCILDGGADHYTYFDGQQMTLGVNLANVGKPCFTGSAKVRVTVVKLPRRNAPLFSHEWQVDVPPGGVQRLTTTWRPESWPTEGLDVTVQLFVDGVVTQTVSHRVYGWKPKRKPSFVKVSDGHFMLDGRPWRPHGVNYMASSGVGIADYPFFRYWLSAKSYDPVVVQRDLDHIKDIGFDAVSVFLFNRDTEAQNLLDFLRRAERLQLKVNLFLDPSSPKNYDFTPIRKMIEQYRLAENDTVFAYDIDWEPIWGTHEDRMRWDRDWENWVIERYGSVANAERDWGFTAPRDKDGRLTNPLGDQIDNDGDWRAMVAAYRRFLDTFVYKRYSAAARLIKGADPNHLVSFRMSDGGSPTFKSGGRMVYDFPYLGAALDFLSPEGYGRIGSWDRTKPGWFEREYARWAAPGKPMIWAEVGASGWDPYRMTCPTKRLDYQADTAREFYKMMIASGADGVFWWFYPGGFQWQEGSDCGIINPDGSDRPITKVIRDYAPVFRDFRSNQIPKQPVDWITIDRDKHPDGLFGVYEEVQQKFWKLIDAGRAPGLRTDGTGTTSANCPLIAVGNTPCNGSNPPKYLDGAFDSVEILAKDGKWTAVESGDTVEIDSGKPVLARVSLTNLGEAKWTTEGVGAVSVIAMRPEIVKTPMPYPVAHLGSISLDSIAIAPVGLAEAAEVTITLSAEGRTTFGEKLRVILTQ
jgi:hypothetical protein